ncbi:OmpA family protein [Sulfitobacter sp. S190]|uniref:OmpA family protein n=1 Tax=Sulfitobacter sp. S190 TaxID=2867022 RepID=UPI0021A304B3|nr:OmpA family protein [Sulfitobacter sp. S190]UWR20991.1 OmpA family protein [Sulfitobacter sp. S190]
MRQFLKSSTALSVALAMSLPVSAAAQEACADDAEARSFPCVLPDGVVLETAADAEALLEKEAAAAAEEVEAEAEVEAEVERDAETEVEAEVETAADAETEADVEVEAEAEDTAETEAEAEADGESQDAAEVEDVETEAEGEAEVEAEAEGEAAEAETADGVEPEAGTTEAETNGAETDTAAGTAEPEADVQEEAAAEEATETEDENVAAEGAAEQDAEAQASDAEAVAEGDNTDADVADEVETAGQEENAGENAIADTGADTDTAPADETASTEVTDEQAPEQSATAAEEQPAAAAAAADADAGENTADVQEETLTEEDVRASSEEFETTATGTEEASGSDDDDGLSKFEKALLLGLGAVAVGQLLDNGDEVVSRSGDRVVVQRDGQLRVLKDDDALLRQPGNAVRTETFNDGSTRTTVTREDDSRIVTIRAADGTVLRRLSITPDGQEILLFDDTQEIAEVDVSTLPDAPVAEAQSAGTTSEEDLRAALIAEQARAQDRVFSLRQVREIEQVRALAPQIELDAVRFASGSAAIQPEQARSLSRIGNALAELVREDPRTVFLIEGHTDAVGDATYNLALSDRRAETVALALSEYFDVPPENMITQGYGESALKVDTSDAEPANRRAVVRNITTLLRQASNGN